MPHSSFVSHDRARVPPATPASAVRAASGSPGVGLLPVGPLRARTLSSQNYPHRSLRQNNTSISRPAFLAAASTLLRGSQAKASHVFEFGSDALSGHQCASARSMNDFGADGLSTVTTDVAAGAPTRLAADIGPDLWTGNSSASRRNNSPQRNVVTANCSLKNERLGGFRGRCDSSLATATFEGGSAATGSCLERLDQMEEGMHRIQGEIEQLEWQFQQHPPRQRGIPRMELASVGNKFLRIGRPELTHPNLAFRQARQKAVEGLTVAAASKQKKSPTRTAIKTQHPPLADKVHGAGLIASHGSLAQRRCTKRTLPEVVGASLGLLERSKDE
mmetsp:Transcript_87725/g.174106  ORF Transcript_87725/g.174106 Transcript_87725/m.174106 type:complete len:332 (-) Transcript_87725:154-1149(-)